MYRETNDQTNDTFAVCAKHLDISNDPEVIFTTNNTAAEIASAEILEQLKKE